MVSLWAVVGRVTRAAKNLADSTRAVFALQDHGRRCDNRAGPGRGDWASPRDAKIELRGLWECTILPSRSNE